MNMECKSFNSLAQRMAYTVLGTFPDFIPLASDDADERSQRLMFDFLWGIANRIYEDCGVLGLPGVPDDGYEFWQVNNRKPELMKAMKAINTKIGGFYELLYILGAAGAVVDGKLHIDKETVKKQAKLVPLLERFGICCEKGDGEYVLSSGQGEGLFPAWKLLSRAVSSCGNPVAAFSRGMFDTSCPHGSHVFARLSGNEILFHALEEFFGANGYRRSDIITEGGSRIEWRKAFTARDEGGINIWYDFRKKHPVFFELKVPRFRELLYRFDGMGSGLKELAIERTKKCDGCGYCIQTDKAKRKQLTFDVNYQGTDYRVCPLYPYLSWHYIDDKAVANMENLLLFAESELKVM